jgi:hypothetical protein
MPICARCKTQDTELYENGIPICLSCSGEPEAAPIPWNSNNPIKEALMKEVLDTTARKNEAFINFNALMLHSPTRLPHPDGVQTIKNASAELAIARKEMDQAHDRLNAYLNTGIVPVDLKRSG